MRELVKRDAFGHQHVQLRSSGVLCAWSHAGSDARHACVTGKGKRTFRLDSFTKPLCSTPSPIMNTSTAMRRLQRIPQQFIRHHNAAFRQPLFPANFQRNLFLQTTPPSLLRKQPAVCRIANQVRRESTEAAQRPLTDRQETSQKNENKESDEIAARKAQEPSYELVSQGPTKMDFAQHIC